MTPWYFPWKRRPKLSPSEREAIYNFHVLGYPWFTRSPKAIAIRHARIEAERLKTKAASGTVGCRAARPAMRQAKHAQLSAELGR